MRTLKRNKQKMYYSLMGTDEDRVPIFDYYRDDDGNEYKIESGEYIIPYLSPEEFSGNIAMSGGDAEASEFGLNTADYEAILVVSKDSIPIDEKSVIWFDSEPIYNREGIVNEKSADYSVVKHIPSLNVDRYALKKVVK